MLDIRLDAEPAKIHAFADWLDNLRSKASSVSIQTLKAVNQSEGGWGEDAAEAFRSLGRKKSSEAHALHELLRLHRTGALAFAKDMDVVQIKLDNAFDHAVKGGLSASRRRHIEDPGPAPPRPEIEPMGKGRLAQERVTGLTPEQRQSWDAWNGWHRKATVYAECAMMVAEARAYEMKALELAKDINNRVIDDSPVTVSEWLVGVSGAYLARQHGIRTTIANFKATAVENLAKFKNASLDPKIRVDALAKHVNADFDMRAQERRANASKLGRYLEKLPRPIQRTLTLRLGEKIPRHAPYLRNAPPVIKQLPVVGTALSAGTIAWDITTSENPVTAAVANASGLGVAATVGRIPGLWGLSAAAIAGTQTTAMVESYVEHWGTGAPTLHALESGVPGSSGFVGSAEMWSTYAKVNLPEWIAPEPDMIIAPEADSQLRGPDAGTANGPA